MKGLLVALAAVAAFVAVAPKAEAANYNDIPHFRKGLVLTTSGAFATKTAVDYHVKTTGIGTELLALNATPITVVAAPGSGYANVFMGAALRWDYVSAACGGVHADENLVFAYTDASGELVSPYVETTGFIDQTADKVRYVQPLGGDAAVSDVAVVDNAAIVIKMLTGEVTSCVGELRVRVYYRVIPLTL